MGIRAVSGVFCCIVILICLIPTGVFAQALVLVRGQQKTIDAPDMNRIAVGNPAVADVKALNKQILVTAIDQGQTDIIIWDVDNKQRSITVRVVETDPRVVAREIRQLLKGIEGIRVIAMNTKVIIEGKALRKEDLNTIQKIAAIYPQVTNLATLSPAVLDTISNHINIEFKEAELIDVSAERLGRQILIQGEVSNEEEKAKINMIAAAFDVDVNNLVKVGVSLKKMILVNVDFIEIDKSKMTEVGIDWDDMLRVSSQSSGGAQFGHDAESRHFNGAYKIDASYGVTIKMLQDKGNAHIIARPKLLCRSGEKAEFLAGGEIPIKIATLSISRVEWKEFGILLNIEPVVDNNDNIATGIKVENSTITDFVDGQPSFQTSRVKTNINVKSGEVIVLSGLVNREHAKAVNKVPFLGSIPILGELFKSRSFKSNQSELLIFVTPVVMSPNDPENKQMIQQTRDNNRNIEDTFGFKLMD
jgi:pilus assembly protein CpaC